MVHGVVMAGGIGSRFWPVSRQSKPKQFLPILGKQTLLDQTFSRFSGLIDFDRLWLMANKSHRSLLTPYLKWVPKNHVLLEPVMRNTAAAIGWAAIRCLAEDPDAVMVIVPADHYISPSSAFKKTINQAIEWVQNEDRLITIGVAPTNPHTGYGYIQIYPNKHSETFSVRSFKEKPDHATALKYLASGNYCWNSGIFVWKAQHILQCFKQHMPAHYRLLDHLKSATTQKEIAAIFTQFDSIAIDTGILEKAVSDMGLIKASFQWSDIGSWRGLAPFWTKDTQNNATSGSVSVHNGSGNVVYALKHHVVLNHVDDLIVIDTDDALLIMPKNRDQDIKTLLNDLPKELL